MKIQMLKMNSDYKYNFTVIKDTEREYPEQYALYIHMRKLNKDGYYTTRRYLVDRVWNMSACLAWIMDIMDNEKSLVDAISAKQILS